MTGNDPSLIVRIAANISALQADMATASAAIRGLEDAATSSSANAGGAFDALTVRTVALGVALEHALEAAVRMLVHGIGEGIEHAANSGARLEQLSGVAVALGERAGYTATQIKDLANEMQRTGITGVQANSAIVEMTRYQFELSDALKLQAAAQNSASIAGKNSSEVLGNLIHGIVTLQPELIRNAGFTVSLQQAEQEWHKETGRATTELSTHEKQVLLLNAVLKQNKEVLGTANDALATYHLSMTYASKVAESSVRAWEQVSEQLGMRMLPVTTAVYMAWYHLGEATRDAIAQSPVLEAALKSLGAALGTTFDDKSIINAANIEKVIRAIAFAAVDTGIAAVSLAGVFVDAWHMMKLPVIAVEQVVVGLTADLITLMEKAVGLASAMPGIGGQFAGVAAITKDWGLYARAAADDLHQQFLEAVQVANSGGAAGAALDKLGGVLFMTRDAMIEASKTTVDYTQKAKELDLTHKDMGKSEADLVAVNKAFAKAMAELSEVGDGWKGTLLTIDGAVVEAIRYYLQAGVAQGALATAYGLTATQVKAVASAIKEETEARKIEIAVADELKKVQIEYYKAVAAGSHDTLGVQMANADLAAEAEIAAMKKAKNYSVEAELAIVATSDVVKKNLIQNNLESDVNTQAHFQLLADKAKIAYDRAIANATQYRDADIQALRDTAEAAALTAAQWGMATSAAAKVASDAIKGVTKSYWDLIDAAAIAAGVTVVGNRPTGIGDAGFNNPSVRGGLNDGGLHPLRADGGPVNPGTSYIVGERGPELFTPAASGMITPNGGGASTMNIYVTAPEGTDPNAFARKIGDAIMARQRNIGQRF